MFTGRAKPASLFIYQQSQLAIYFRERFCWERNEDVKIHVAM